MKQEFSLKDGGNSMLFAVVKRYERNGVDFADWEYKPNAHEKIYG